MKEQKNSNKKVVIEEIELNLKTSAIKHLRKVISLIKEECLDEQDTLNIRIKISS